MTKKQIIKTTIIIATLIMFLVMSTLSCNDKFDEMCEKYPQLHKNLFKPQFNENYIITTKIIPPTDDNIKDIKKGLWALFEITLAENIVPEIDMNNNENLLKSIVNSNFFFNNTPFISLFKNNNNSQVYLFVSDIRTNCQGKEEESLFMKSDNIKEINVICSSDRRNSGDIRYLFSECKNLEKVNLENLKLNGLTVDRLFYQCDKLNKIILQNFNGDKNKVFSFRNLLDGVKSDKSKGFIKLSCTEHFFSEIFACGVNASWYDENKGKSFIPNYDWNENHKKELQYSNRYREFTLCFDVEDQ